MHVKQTLSAKGIMTTTHFDVTYTDTSHGNNTWPSCYSTCGRPIFDLALATYSLISANVL